MKPAVYLTALERGYTLLSPIDDSPLTYTARDGQVWQPKNYDRKDHGLVRLYSALAKSYNQSTARLGLELGVSNVVRTIKRLGVDADVPSLPSVFLGSVNMSPLEVAGMYQTIASGGFITPLRAIREVLDANGRPLLRYAVDVEQTMDSRAVYLLEYALKAVATEGTARSLQYRLPAKFTVAGKTGTTDDQRDSWFAGYSGDLLAVVWVGRDDNAKTPLTGSSGALPVWSRIMADVSQVPLDRRPPPGVTERWVDVAGGGQSASTCSSSRLVPFIDGSEPDFKSACGGEVTRPDPPKRWDAGEEEGRGFWERLFGR